MEQKQIDELEDSYKGEEFIDEEDFDDILSERQKAKSKRGRPKKAAELKADKNRGLSDNDERESVGESVKVTPLKEETKISSQKEKKISQKDQIDNSSEGPSFNPWDDEEEETGSKASTWKVITGILVVLLIISIFTHGFNFSGGVTGAAVADLSLSDAEQKALNYVNTNLLQPPFVAELKGSEDVGSMYKITLSVAGQEINSYLTKDGNLFFPQGFDTAKDLVATANTTTDADVDTVKLDISIDDDAVKGNKDAPVTIVEFSEFQCPYCGKYFRESYPKIIKKYVDTGKVKYVFRDFPLDFHPNAQKAAEAAECAGEQNKYYEMHDYLFENQDYLEIENLIGYAKDLKLDTAKFNDCLDSKKMEAEVKEDLADGKKYGVSGTPTFFINGKMLSGAQPYSVFEKEIKTALDAAEGEEDGESLLEEAPPEVEEESIEEPAGEEPVEEEPAATQTREFTINAKKWLFSPNELTVTKNDNVKLTIIPSELEFTFSLPELNVEKEIAGNTIIEFTASKSGSFEFKCSSCEDWRGMTGTLVVE